MLLPSTFAEEAKHSSHMTNPNQRRNSCVKRSTFCASVWYVAMTTDFFQSN
jgi:hypothetical protein